MRTLFVKDLVENEIIPRQISRGDVRELFKKKLKVIDYNASSSIVML